MGAGVLAASSYSTAIIHGDAYAAKADAQYAKPSGNLFDRGTIYFSDKDGRQTPAATKKSGFLIYINPKLITDPLPVYQALSNYVKIDQATFLAKAKKANDPYEELVHDVDQAAADAVRGLRINGLAASPENKRSYPGGSLAAHELGLTGESATSTAVSGRYGLERAYDAVLRRSAPPGAVNAFAQLFADIESSVLGGGDPHAGDIVTTIEPKVEAYLDSALVKIRTTWHSDEIGGIIMDPHTGEIVAMSSLPTFDPNDTAAVKDVSVFSNSLVEHAYEMGSIMKPLTMAVALDSGRFKPTSTYDDTGCMTLDTKKICNFDGKARGIVPMQQILSQSLNIGAVTLGLKVGAADFTRYFESFGVTAKTGIDLPNEATPLTKNLKSGRDIAIATASYGQGISVSPVGMIRALAVLANGGYVITPHLVKEINYTDGSTKEIKTDRGSPVFKAETLDDVKDMLVTVVDKALANGSIKREHYTVAAKTGTAEVPDPVNGGYYSDRYLHSFFGFFPAYNPRFIVFLYQINPKGAQYASETLVKPFDDITTFLLNYYNIPPDR